MEKEMIVKIVGESSEGISQRTGDSWKNRTLLLEWNEGGVTNRIWAALFNEVLDQFERQNIKPGDACWVNVVFSARTYRTGFCRTEASITAIEKQLI